MFQETLISAEVRYRTQAAARSGSRRKRFPERGVSRSDRTRSRASDAARPSPATSETETPLHWEVRA